MYYSKMNAEERKQYDAKKLAWAQLQKDFVRNSEQISGRGYENPDDFWKSEGVDAHLELAKILNTAGCNYVGIWLINSTLTRRPNKCLRTGIPGMSKGLVPEGHDVERRLHELDQKIRSDFEHYRNASAEEKDMRAWSAHDEVLCGEFFKSGNGRTGRLLLNHVRTIFGLDTFVIQFQKSAEYYSKLQTYKITEYLPRLQAPSGIAA